MNKVFLGLILAVCVLGMALVMLNDRLGRKQEIATASQTSVRPLNSSRMAAGLTEDRAFAIAEQALDPPAHFPTPLPAKTQEAPHAETPLSVPEIVPAPTQALPPRIEANEPAAAPEPPRPVAPKAEVPKAEPARAVEPVKAEPVKPEPLKTEAPAQPSPTPTKATAAPAAKSVTRFVTYARDKGATVRIGGNSKVEYSSMTLDDPSRVVVDLDGEWKFPPNPGIPKNDLVSAVRVGKNGDKTRVVIDLKTKPRKVILVPFKSGDGVDVRVDK